MKKIISSNQIEDAIEYIADILNDRFTLIKDDCIAVVSVLDGGIYFTTDLTREFTFPHELHTFGINTYEKDCCFSTEKSVVITKTFDVDLLDKKHIIILDEFNDSGDTIRFILNYMKESYIFPQSISIATLIKRKSSTTTFSSDSLYCWGIEVEDDQWLVGYGLNDDLGHNRNLRDIYSL